MHTLLIHQGFTTPSDAGGTRHYELAQFALSAGQRVSVVASDFGYLSGQRRASSLAGRTEEVDGIRVLRVATSPSLHRGLAGQLLSFLSFSVTSFLAALRVRDVDVVMGTSPPIFQGVTAWAVAAIKRRPFLLEIRDLWPEFIVDMGKLSNPIAIRAARWLERFLYARAAHLLVNSPAYVEYLVSKGVAPERITLIPNGVDPTMFSLDATVPADVEAIRHRYGLEGTFVVMYAGVMGPANDLGVLLDAAALLRDEAHIRIVLVGDGKSRKMLEAQSERLGLSNVVFAGAQPKSAMRAFLQTADLCVATLQNIAMFRMTYPNKVFDYLAAAKPVALAIDGVIREVVEAADAGLFAPPGDPHALAAVIRELSRDPVRCQAMGRRGLEYVTRTFNRREQGDRFARLLAATGARP